MPELEFKVEGVEPERFAATPLLNFKLRVTNTTPAISIRNIMLQCQIRIETTRRRYEPSEQERLKDLFGEPERWDQTLNSMLWAHVNVLVPSFGESCVIDLPVPCSFDFNLGSTKYFHGLEDGDAPLTLLFSGTVFYGAPDDALQLDQIPWSQEALYRFPVKAWQAMMDHYYPDSVWLRLNRDAFDRIYRYKRERGLPTWEQAVLSLLDHESRLTVEDTLP